MNRKKNKSRAASTIEYASLVTFVIVAIIIFRVYILRGISGQWKRAGDTFGHGKQYDPRDPALGGGGTENCFYEWKYCTPANWKLIGGAAYGVAALYECSDSGGDATTQIWIDSRCYYKTRACDCTVPVESQQYLDDCLQCIADCECGNISGG